MDKRIKLSCPFCGHTLGYGKPGSEIELKCPRKGCKRIINIKIKSDESVEHTAIGRE